MQRISLILKKLMEVKKLNESQLAKSTGLGQSVIHRLVSGKTYNPKVITLQSIASYFSLSISQLIGDQPLPWAQLSTDHPRLLKNWAYLPILTWKTIPFWLSNPSLNNKLIDNTIEWIPTNLSVSKQAYAVGLHTHTLQPLFPKNTLFIVEPSLQPHHKDYIILKLQKELTLKQLVSEQDHIYAVSVNKPYYKTKIHADAKCQGVLLQAQLNFSHVHELPPLSQAMNMEKFKQCA